MVNHNMILRDKEFVLDTPKTAASRDVVVMTAELRDKLLDVKSEQDRLKAVADRRYEYVCSWEDGRPLSPMYITKTFSKYVARYGFKKITFHGMRHTHASILYINGASSHDISKRLRHSRVATTDDIYIHINKEVKKSTANLFSNAIEKNASRTDRTDEGQIQTEKTL